MLNISEMRSMEYITQQVGTVRFAATSPSDAASRLVELAMSAKQKGLAVFFANAYTVSLADSDRAYRDVLNLGGLTFADGKPISWISRLLGHKPPVQQVRGPETFERVIQKGQEHHLRHFLLGSTPEVLDKLECNLRSRFPEALIVGKYSPPFRPLNAEELAEQDGRIRRSEAQIVWVGLGTPRQDFEAARIASTTTMLAIAVGAAFDFSAGTKPTAPAWMRASGLEWVFRLMSEPRRLWKRYFFGNLLFLKSCWKHFGNSRA